MADDWNEVGGNGMTNKELLMRIDGKLDLLNDAFQVERVHTAQELGRRPTRAEVIGWSGGFGTLLGALGFFVGLIAGGG